MRAEIITEIDGFGQRITAVVVRPEHNIPPEGWCEEDYQIETPGLHAAEAFLLPETALDQFLNDQIPADEWKSSLAAEVMPLKEEKNCVVLLLDKKNKSASTKRMLGHGRDATLDIVIPEVKVTCRKENCTISVKEVRDTAADRFMVRKFTDEEGRELSYNLFVPDEYDPKQSYPLVLFLHDAGSCSEKKQAALAQGNGAVIWSLKKEQEKRPCFVVAPQFTTKCAEDDFTVGWEADMVILLIKELRKKYSINKNRIYGTGQSMGCMILCDLNVRYPDFFGACFLVAGQWNPQIMEAAKHKNFWILVSEKDEKAFPIMGACVAAMETAGAKVSRGFWSAKLPEKKQNEAVRNIEKAGSNINFTWFEGDSVLPEGETADFPGVYHVNTWGAAYQIEAIREWLFRQCLTLDFSTKSHVLIRNEDGSVQPMDQPYFEAECVAPGTWKILSDGDYSYLVEGTKEAVVIDSGYGCGNIREFCQSLTKRPVKNIINTHDHFDHTANNYYFECAYMSEQTAPLATRPFKSFEGIRFPRDYDIRIIREGDIIDLGGRTLEVFEIPDHAVGSIALLDRKEKLLFCGDEFCMPMGKPLNGTVERFLRYLNKLLLYRKDIHKLLGGPGICDAVLLDQLSENANYILAGHEGVEEQPQKKAEMQSEMVYDRKLPHPEDMPPHAGEPDPNTRVMDYAGTRIIYNKNKVYELERGQHGNRQ